MTSSYFNLEPYIPTTTGEIYDFLGSMILGAPTFRDSSGFFPNRNAESEFFALNEGLKAIRKKIGEDNYERALELSAKAKAYFEADPEDKTEDGIKGRDCLMDIEEILKAANRRKR